MFQQITLVGNLGRDPELRYTPGGKQVCDFSLAVNEGKDSTAWFNVSVWGSQAESVSTYLHKGSPALVVGRLRYTEDGSPRTYTRKDGTHGATFEVTADRVRFLPSNRDEPVYDDGTGNLPF